MTSLIVEDFGRERSLLLSVVPTCLGYIANRVALQSISDCSNHYAQLPFFEVFLFWPSAIDRRRLFGLFDLTRDSRRRR